MWKEDPIMMPFSFCLLPPFFDTFIVHFWSKKGFSKEKKNLRSVVSWLFYAFFPASLVLRWELLTATFDLGGDIKWFAIFLTAEIGL